MKRKGEEEEEEASGTTTMSTIDSQVSTNSKSSNSSKKRNHRQWGGTRKGAGRVKGSKNKSKAIKENGRFNHHAWCSKKRKGNLSDHDYKMKSNYFIFRGRRFRGRRKK